MITNARADHFEEIGETSEAAAAALRWVVPGAGRLIVSNEAASPELRSVAAARGSAVTVVDTAGLDPRGANRALALAVCAAHEVPAAVAGPAMDTAKADPGSFREYRVTIGGKRVRFANAFACNDVDSLALLWPTVDRNSTPVVLLNARRDRPLRTRRFLEFLAARTPDSVLFITGDPLALRLARAAGFMPRAVRRLRARTAEAALGELAAPAPSDGVIWGLGNFRGMGARLTDELAGSTC